MKLQLFFSSCLLISSLHFAYAGTGSSGGGMAVACSVGNQTTYQLLDLYEAKKNSQIEIVDSQNDLNLDYQTLYRNLFALRKGNNIFDSRNPEVEPSNIDAYINSNFAGLSKLIDWHNDGTPLPSTNDQGQNSVLPANCKLKQVAIFYDDAHKMVVDQRIWEKLDTLSQAALLMHEEFYFNQRQIGDKNSENSRAYVAEVLSKKGAISAYDKGETFQYFCSARNNSLPFIGQTDFFLNISPNAQGGKDLQLQFTYLLGREMLVKSTTGFANVPLELEDIYYGLITSKSTSPIINKEKLETIHANDLEVNFFTTPGNSSGLKIFKDGHFLGSVELRVCNPIR